GADIVIVGTIEPRPHGASDIKIPVGALSIVPRKSPSDYLKLAPGILLTNEGGEGHAEQVFLRGFDAREGQDIEFSVDGVPMNDAGNIHGNGYTDTHFIIPELIRGLRVIEGPYSPSQGNFAVAGSAEYELGLESRGTTIQLSYGSFGSMRALALWAPADESIGTFGAAEAYKTDGYGSNRAAQKGSAYAQYETPMGRGLFRITTQAYGTHYQSAGVVREDDYRSGRIGFFGSEDPNQGGDASRVSIAATYERATDDAAYRSTFFVIRRDMRLLEDFTGFLLDTQNVLDTLHPQRGDLIDLSFQGLTFGGSGFGRWSTTIGGLKQEIDVGYFARVDDTTSTQNRLMSAPALVPYRTDTNLQSTIVDVGLYVDTTLRFLEKLMLRGGARVDAFDYDVNNLCAAQGDFDNPSKLLPPINQPCHDQMQNGQYREPTQRSTTGAVKIMPRASIIAGPFEHVTLSASYGLGVRSVDPTYISQNLDTPFASVTSYEVGATYAHDLGPFALSARAVAFDTHVDRDLVFSETQGRNVLSNGTTRKGMTFAIRASNSFLDESANFTFVDPRYDDTGLQIPYVPTTVFRDDFALFAVMPFTLQERPIRGTLGVGYSYVGKRALPYNQVSDVVSVVDASASLAWWGWTVTLAATNLLDTRYRLGEYNYASDFHSQPQPTLVPAREFSAGAPRMFMLSIAKNLGGE
ncbi:MAG: TonB-dependent receptor, partial [Polyangiales bacterium]